MSESQQVAILSAACEKAIDALTVTGIADVVEVRRILTDGLTDVGMADFSCGPWTLKKRRAFMALPVEERRAYMAEQAEKALLNAPWLKEEG